MKGIVVVTKNSNKFLIYQTARKELTIVIDFSDSDAKVTLCLLFLLRNLSLILTR